MLLLLLLPLALCSPEHPRHPPPHHNPSHHNPLHHNSHHRNPSHHNPTPHHQPPSHHPPPPRPENSPFRGPLQVSSGYKIPSHPLPLSSHTDDHSHRSFHKSNKENEFKFKSINSHKHSSVKSSFKIFGQGVSGTKYNKHSHANSHSQSQSSHHSFGPLKDKTKIDTHSYSSSGSSSGPLGNSIKKLTPNAVYIDKSFGPPRSESHIKHFEQQKSTT